MKISVVIQVVLRQKWFDGGYTKIMIEVYANLWVGNQLDFERKVEYQQGWATIHTSKEPYHRKALGYSGRAASKHHPEYLFAYRNSALVLNPIDADVPSYIPKAVIDEALGYIADNLAKGDKVLVHCNQGCSRSPGIALLFVAQKGEFSGLSYAQAKVEFLKIYPYFSPAGGMEGFCSMNWDAYRLDGR